jgi:L-ascorbate metabolism protein UlaG (beta-lactamase superfamily)
VVLPKADLTFAAERLQCEPSRLVGVDAGTSVRVGGVDFYGVPAAHDTLDRSAAGWMKCLGYVVVLGDYTIFHAGDTLRYGGDVLEINAALKRANLARVHGLRTSPIDLAILPINGKVGNMNGTEAAQLSKQINARLVVPCHYHMFEFNTAEPEELFVPECEKLGQAYRVLRMGERLSLTVFS